MTFSVQSIPDQSGKIAVVTGANSGIGLETARVLAEKGARVILACRSPDKAEAARAKIRPARGGAAEVLRLDLSDLASVEAFAEALAETLGKEHERLDLLINNAGIMMPPLGRTKTGLELQFGTNHLGHFALTARLMPLLKAAGPARVVTVSSLMHKRGKIDFDNLDASKGYSKTGAYARSKLANLLFTYELDRRLRAARSEVMSVAAHPGWTATNLQDETPIFKVFNPLLAMEPLGGALPTLRAATDPETSGGEYYGPTGLMEIRGPAGKVRSNRRSHDEAVAKRLWEVSEELTGFPFPL